MSADPSLLDPSDRVVSVIIEGRAFELPGDNTVLRILQYLEVDLYPCRLCWNGDCDNCRFTYIDPGTESEVTAKGCQAELVDGMRIIRIPENAEWPPKS